MIDIIWILKNKIFFRKRYSMLHEPEVQKLAKTLHGDTFIDIGSNTGRYSKLLRKNFNCVYTVDPNPKYKAQFQVAISNYNGKSNFYIHDNIGGGDSLIKDPFIHDKEWKSIKSYQVEVITFDDLVLKIANFQHFNFGKHGLILDLVKIDVEGAEFEVIDGMKEHLPKNVIIELHDNKREEELVRKMMSKGYDSYFIDHDHRLFKRVKHSNILWQDRIPFR